MMKYIALLLFFKFAGSPCFLPTPNYQVWYLSKFGPNWYPDTCFQDYWDAVRQGRLVGSANTPWCVRVPR
jgi:hypothetical protein